MLLGSLCGRQIIIGYFKLWVSAPPNENMGYAALLHQLLGEEEMAGIIYAFDKERDTVTIQQGQHIVQTRGVAFVTGMETNFVESQI
jgi:hypothetical protein